MVTREVVIKNRSGLESKSAAMLIQKASNYKSSIWVERDERKANAKSFLGLLSLGIANESKIVIIAEGADEAKAINEIEDYIKSGFGESV